MVFIIVAAGQLLRLYQGDVMFFGGFCVCVFFFFFFFVVCLFVAERPGNMLVYLRDGSDQIIVRAATLRQTLQIKPSSTPSHSILTPGRPVPALTL